MSMMSGTRNCDPGTGPLNLEVLMMEEGSHGGYWIY
jgi:hypothetical protein